MTCKFILLLAAPIALAAATAPAAENPGTATTTPTTGAATTAAPATAAAAPTATASNNATNKSKGDPNRLICRSTDDSSSRLSRGRVCHTASEWEELRRQSRQDIEHIQNARAYNQ